MKIILGLMICGGLTATALGAAAAAPLDNSLVDGPAMIQSWKPPVYPAAALQQKVGGRAVIRFIVDDKGVLTSARIFKAADARLGEAALAAVKTWTFTPAVENEKPITSCLDVILRFDPAKGQKSWPANHFTDMSNQPAASPMTSAEPKQTPPGEYPAILVERKLPGSVEFSCRLDATGQVLQPKILATSHTDFLLPALASLKKWEFTPAKQGDLAVPTQLVGEVTFDTIAGNRADVLAANAITAPDGTVPELKPQPVLVTDAVWPHGLLLRGDGGEAVVEFTVQMSGAVTDVNVRSASQPEFGRAALAAMEMWRFRPAITDGRKEPVILVKKFEFIAVPKVAPAEAQDPWVELVNEARADALRSAGGLDERIEPLYQAPLRFPEVLKAAGGAKGEAMIEFVIARDGRVRLPRIVSASAPEFGWAAATSVSQWLFNAPRREGKPVDVKVAMPMSFDVPQS